MYDKCFAADVVIKLADVQAENDVETQFEHKFAELVNEKKRWSN